MACEASPLTTVAIILVMSSYRLPAGGRGDESKGRTPVTGSYGGVLLIMLPWQPALAVSILPSLSLVHHLRVHTHTHTHTHTRHLSVVSDKSGNFCVINFLLLHVLQCISIILQYFVLPRSQTTSRFCLRLYLGVAWERG